VARTKKNNGTPEPIAVRRLRLHRLVTDFPGSYDRYGLARKLGVSTETVYRDLRAINALDSSFLPIRYGRVRGRTGYFAANRKAHLAVLDQHDEKCEAIGRGIHESRIVNLDKAAGLRYSDEVVANIQARIGRLSSDDQEALLALVEDIAA